MNILGWFCSIVAFSKLIEDYMSYVLCPSLGESSKELSWLTYTVML